MKAALEENKEYYSHMDKKRGWVLSKFLNIPELKTEDQEGEVVDMCTAIEEMIRDGRDEGITQGERKVNRLIQILLEESKQDEITRAVYDQHYQKKLFEKYGI